MAPTARIGAAGQFYTTAQLAQRGWDASLTLGNTPRTDIIAQHIANQRLIAVQCKASSGGGKFRIGQRGETPSPPGRDEWFVLISLRKPDERPDFFIVPRNVVAAYVYVGHRAWLTAPAKDGKPHQDQPQRDMERRAAGCYHERWDLLEAPADAAPSWLPDWVFDWEPHTGLPAGHPGLVKPTDTVQRPIAERWVPPVPSATSSA